MTVRVKICLFALFLFAFPISAQAASLDWLWKFWGFNVAVEEEPQLPPFQPIEQTQERLTFRPDLKFLRQVIEYRKAVDKPAEERRKLLPKAIGIDGSTKASDLIFDEKYWWSGHNVYFSLFVPADKKLFYDKFDFSDQANPKPEGELARELEMWSGNTDVQNAVASLEESVAAFLDAMSANPTEGFPQETPWVELQIPQPEPSSEASTDTSSSGDDKCGQEFRE